MSTPAATAEIMLAHVFVAAGNVDPADAAAAARAIIAEAGKLITSGDYTAAAAWDAARHPRGRHGRFGDGTGSLAAARSSIEVNTDTSGRYTPGRNALHQQIIDKMLAGHKPQAEPVATFFGGGPGSGKSSTLRGPADAAMIAADDVKPQLPEYGQLQKANDPRASVFVHDESIDVANAAVKQARAGHLNYVLDGTGNHALADVTAQAEDARKAGYAVHAKYVTVDTKTALARAAARAAKTGRTVPAAVIRDRHASVSRIFPAAVKNGLWDHAELWDNNGGPGQGRLIAHATGKNLTVTDGAAYQRFLDKGSEGGQ